MKILREAIRAVPAVKYALGVAGIISAIAIVKGIVNDSRVAVFGFIIMVVLMVLLIVFARLTTITESRIFVGPMIVLVWSSLLLTVSVAALLFTSVFFRWPVDLQHWVRSDVDGGVIPNSVTISLPAGMSVRDATRTIAEINGHIAVFSNCSEEFLNSRVEPGRLMGDTPKDLLETLQSRIIGTQPTPKYRIDHARAKGTYEIYCER